jgi:AcrR family transcriptional regulator
MGGTLTAEPGLQMRADARRNRERIIEAARDVFLEHGPDAPLDAIAERAGVGNATLYRNFADRQELLVGVALASIDAIVGHAEAALADDVDPFEGLRRFAHSAADERIGSLCSVFCGGLDRPDPRAVEARRRLERAVDRVIARARRSGQLRDDVDRGDLIVPITQLTRPAPGTVSADFVRFIHRHLELFLDGLHAPARSTLPGSAATLEDLQRRNV